MVSNQCWNYLAELVHCSIPLVNSVTHRWNYGHWVMQYTGTDYNTQQWRAVTQASKQDLRVATKPQYLLSVFKAAFYQLSYLAY